MRLELWRQGIRLKQYRVRGTKCQRFTGVSLSVPAKAEIVQRGSEGVSIETDDNILPLIACRDPYLNPQAENA